MSAVIERWEDWPADVVDLLRKWNHERVLSFYGRSAFECNDCWQAFPGNRYGNAVVNGSNVCDQCLIKAARWTAS